MACRGFLVTVIDKKNDETRIEDITVVKEYPDVFPEDLWGLHPDREEKFSTDLSPGTNLILETPYRSTRRNERIKGSVTGVIRYGIYST